MKKIILGLISLAMAIVFLSACGQKGNLYLPEPLPKAIPSPAK